MHDLVHFAVITLLVSLALLVAVGSQRVAEWVRIPAPAIFLIAAAVASDVVPKLGGLDIITDQRVVTIALVVILFDGALLCLYELVPFIGALLCEEILGDPCEQVGGGEGLLGPRVKSRRRTRLRTGTHLPDDGGEARDVVAGVGGGVYVHL